MITNKQAIRFILIIFSFFLAISAYAVQLKDFDGKPRTFDESISKGRWTVVILWHSTCRISNAVVHEYVDFHTLHSDSNSTVLGISLDGYEHIANAKGFIDKHDIEFPNLIGDYDDIVNMVESLTDGPWGGTPTFLIYSPAGELRAAQSGGVPAKIIEDYIKKQQ